MHFGIFAEELRHGRSQAESFRDVLELAERADSGSVENATVAPRPYQVPHPPLRMATTSDETFPVAGRMQLRRAAEQALRQPRQIGRAHV